MATFIPGLELSRALYEEAVRPILAAEYPGLPHAAARIGAGSEVLGYDTARSTDHDWGPQLQLFLPPSGTGLAGADSPAERIRALLADRLPKRVHGWPTHFRRNTDPADPVGFAENTDGPVDHRVSVTDVGGWLAGQLGTDPAAAEPTVVDWLAMPQQKLAEVTGGAVFHDGPGTLSLARRRLAWYPDQVWRYLLACQWTRISQEEAFVGRCAEIGDQLGAAVVAARLVRDLMRLCLLLARRYAPYGKWLGSAFARLPIADPLTGALTGALAATDHQARQRHLGTAYRIVGEAQNATGLAEPVDPTPRPYHNRPYLVLHAERFAAALTGTLTDPLLRRLPPTGAVDQWADSTDLLGHQAALRATVTALTDQAHRQPR